MKRIAGLAALLALGGCTTAQIQAANNRVVVAGQLFCAQATATGPLVIALADASGVPVVVTGMASAWVKAACAAVNGIPTTPPPNPAQAPVVAAPVPPPVPAAPTVT